jgi:REP element-mobilizing transposase RayT
MRKIYITIYQSKPEINLMGTAMNDQNLVRNTRKIVRLQDFDYSQNGAYFITIVVQDRLHLFGQVFDGEMCLNDAGKMIQEICDKVPVNNPGVEFDPYQIMPNHIHAIVLIRRESNGRPQWGAPTENQVDLLDIVGRFKSLTTRRYIQGVKQFGWMRFDKRLWQRSFYEHIIRNERDHEAIVDYIYANPLNWQKDDEFIDRK